VLGIVRTYATRVGEGPFPTEMIDAEEQMADLIRQRGNEYGSVTRRPRRCGWFDAVATRYAAELNGFDSIALTKLDVLDALDEIKVCVGYDIEGKRVDTFPAVAHELRMIKPIYETLKGWKSDTVGVTDFGKLPKRAQEYVRFLSHQIGVEIGLISTGPERDQTVLLPDSVMESWFVDHASVASAES
jgi:adenylosuccinate synthase